MGCFFAQNLTVFRKSKPKTLCERSAAKPSVFAARLRACVYMGSVQYDPQQTVANTNFEHKGLSIDPCGHRKIGCLTVYTCDNRKFTDFGKNYVRRISAKWNHFIWEESMVILCRKIQIGQQKN